VHLLDIVQNDKSNIYISFIEEVGLILDLRFAVSNIMWFAKNEHLMSIICRCEDFANMKDSRDMS